MGSDLIDASPQLEIKPLSIIDRGFFMFSFIEVCMNGCACKSAF